MDLFNRAYTPLNSLFRSMTPGSRLTAGLLLLVVVISVGYLFAHPMPATTVDLMRGKPIPAGHLEQMLAAFKKSNLTTYELHGDTIFIPRGEEAAYSFALVDAKALPPGFGAARDEAINSGNIFEVGSLRERNRINNSWQKDAEVAIEAIPGIEKAWVHYDEELKSGLSREKQATALVCVKPAGSSRLEQGQVKKVHDIVFACKVGMDHKNVTVADLNGDTWRGDIDEGIIAGNRLHSIEDRLEKGLKTKIVGILGDIPNVMVEVNVELNRLHDARPKPSKPDPSADAAKDAPALALSGKRTVAPSAANATAVLDALLNNAPGTGNRESPPPAASEPARESLQQENLAPTPGCVRVSITVPRSYLRLIREKQYGGSENHTSKAPDLEQVRKEESERIQACVAPILPTTEGNNQPVNPVTVTDFEDTVSSEMSRVAWREEGLAWLRRHGGMAALVGLSLVSVLVLRLMARDGAAEMRSASLLTAAKASATSETAPTNQEAPVSIPMRRRQAGATDRPDSNDAAGSGSAKRREDLAEIVRRDPDTAASILRNWVGNSG